MGYPEPSSSEHLEHAYDFKKFPCVAKCRNKAYVKAYVNTKPYCKIKEVGLGAPLNLIASDFGSSH